MGYDLSKLPFQKLSGAMSDAGSAWVRLDERIARSSIGRGWQERSHYLDACASLWIDGELVHIDDLVLHDAGHDIRTPTHELSVARDVLRSRRRIAAQPADWCFDMAGLQALRSSGKNASNVTSGGLSTRRDMPVGGLLERAIEREGQEGTVDAFDPFAKELAAIDAVLARSEAALNQASAPVRRNQGERDPLIYDVDWNEEQRLIEWLVLLRETEGLPAVLRAVLALDSWNHLAVLQHAPWMGRLLAASCLRQGGVTTAAHLASFNLVLKAVPFERRTHRDRDTRLLALLAGMTAAGEFGLKEHDRLDLARQMMERRLIGRRSSSKLPELIGLVISRPLVSASMIAQALNVTPRAALRLVEELNLRELTGRGRFRAWGII